MNEKEKRFSNVVGEEYDLFKLSLPHHDLIQRKTVEKVSLFFPSDYSKIKVLEIGFGTGITSELLLGSDPRIQLIALDNEPLMYEKALSKLKRFPTESYELKIVEALEYLKNQPSESFDSIVSVWVLHNIHKDIRSEILFEIFRTLKKGGLFVNGDKIAVSDEEEHRKNFHWQIEQFEIYEQLQMPELKKEWIDHYYEDENESRILKEDVFLQELNQIGFETIDFSYRNYLDVVMTAKKPEEKNN
jgi:tRNA (cmo5U34)-methyltransferase